MIIIVTDLKHRNEPILDQKNLLLSRPLSQNTGKSLTAQMVPPGTWTPPMTMSSFRSRDVPGAVG